MKLKLPEVNRVKYDKLSTLAKAEFLKFAPFGFDPTGLVLPNYLLESGGVYDSTHLEFVHFMSRPENFWFTCKWLLNIDLYPFQVAVLQELWNRKFPMLIAARGFGKTFLLAIYSILRALFHQNCKVVLVSASFRQAKFMFDYITTIYDNSPILKNICGSNNHPKRDIDQCFFDIGQSRITAIPLGDGLKIRGLRANYIIADEFSCLSYNTLIETDKGLIRIGEAESYDLSLINENGDLEKPVNFIKTPLTDVYQVKTDYGFSFKCSSIHTVKTLNGYKLAKDLNENDWLVHSNKYTFPNKSPDGIDSKVSWLLGLLVSEGYVNHRNYFTITNTDYSLIEKIDKTFPELDASIYTRPAYYDERGFYCKESYVWSVHNTRYREFLYSLGLDYSIAINKKIPWSILQSSKENVIEFLKGAFEGDGSCFVWNYKNTYKLGISYYSSSEQLVDEIQVLISKFNLLGSKNSRNSKLSDNLQWLVRYNAEYAKELLALLNLEKFNNITKDVNFNFAKQDKLYTFDKDRNKWKVQFSYCGDIVRLGRFETELEAKNTVSNFFKDKDKCVRVKSVKLLEEKENLYDFYLPMTHSFYGNGFVQHNSIPLEIFEVVIKGFGSVSANPTERASKVSEIELLNELGYHDEANKIEETLGFGNQTIVSGTAYYAFNHFYSYWKRYKTIIESKGDLKVLSNIFPDGKVEEDFDHNDYSIIRIPYEMLPKGFMDVAQISSSKLTMHNSRYQMEYGAIFAEDSDGFFKRSLIETCVTKEPIVTSDGSLVKFYASIIGSPVSEYVYGIDPASEEDNLALTILEVNGDHRRVVYCWTLNKHKLRDRLKNQDEKIGFYSYCARKIRNLMKVFPTKHIGIDAQGGGLQLMEALHNPGDMLADEKPLWPYIVNNHNPMKPDPFWWEMEKKPTDIENGDHILHPIQFASSDFTSQANHGLKKDFETKTTLFPAFSSAILAEALYHDNREKREFDTLEDCVLEIEELKDELASIEHGQTSIRGRETWDTPQIKKPGGKVGRMRKDRYTSLTIANMIARAIENRLKGHDHVYVGGYAGQEKKRKPGQLYTGPENLISQIPSNYKGISYKDRL